MGRMSRDAGLVVLAYLIMAGALPKCEIILQRFCNALATLDFEVAGHQMADKP